MAEQSITNALTDGTGISKITTSKFLKDVSADFLMSVPVSLTGITLFDVASSKAVGLTVVLGIGSAVIGSVYRAWLRWATS